MSKGKDKTANLDFENKYWQLGYKNIAGIDEAGRGCWAGPVVAAAVIFPQNIKIPDLNDSKKISPDLRDELFPIIKETAISYGVGVIENSLIDEINILQATYKAMTQAIRVLNPIPEFLFVDGCWTIPDVEFPQIAIVKGDSHSVSIAAASVLAKVTRDRIMVKYDDVFPEYGFASHKGYGTAKHRRILNDIGPCKIHRKSFAPVRESQLLKLF
jgi:ribonuclease HII